MASDYLLVTGLLIGALAIPSVLAAFLGMRMPRVAVSMVTISVGLMVFAALRRPGGGYSPRDVPDAVMRVINVIIN